MSTELATLDISAVTAVTVYGTPQGVDNVLAQITTAARKAVADADISTPGGREAIRSMAFKVARSKTALDAMGKELGQTHYSAWKAITGERAKIEAALDLLRDQIRKPLTDFEEAERTRVANHEAALDAIKEHPNW